MLANSDTEHNAQVAKRAAFPSPVPTLTANVESLGEELDRPVVLVKATERTASCLTRCLPQPCSKLMKNVETFGVELDRLVVLTMAIERTTQVAEPPAFPSPVPKLMGNVEKLGVELVRLACCVGQGYRTHCPSCLTRCLPQPCFQAHGKCRDSWCGTRSLSCVGVLAKPIERTAQVSPAQVP